MKTAPDFLSASAVRETTKPIYQALLRGETSFRYHPERMEGLVDEVITVIRSQYPDLKIPYHSRWGHFRAGRPERLKSFSAKLRAFDPLERARREIDLVIPSVLLDAGAGAAWMFQEPGHDFRIGRSEGLGIASLYMFLEGQFSNTLQDPLRSDAQKLQSFTADQLRDGFQVSDNNPLLGVEGRAGLIRALGEAIEQEKEFFVGGRPGGLVDYFLNRFGQELPAGEILKALLYGLGSIWPGRLQMDGFKLGDVWEHPQFGKIAFHKLSQWLTYSFLEPLEQAGFQITDMHQLTGLAEYRNGGLFVDGGVIELKKSAIAEKPLAPSDPVVIEWRALTVQLLDEVAPRVRATLQLSESEFPLAKVLEGGTWWTGRKLARAKRPSGDPPLQIQSDGTVF